MRERKTYIGIIVFVLFLFSFLHWINNVVEGVVRYVVQWDPLVLKSFITELVAAIERFE